jgi:hypothetical protein
VSEASHLLEAGDRLPSATGLKPHTFVTLYCLYMATGLRANEALRLDCSDVDLVSGVLTIPATHSLASRATCHCIPQCNVHCNVTTCAEIDAVQTSRHPAAVPANMRSVKPHEEDVDERLLMVTRFAPAVTAVAAHGRRRCACRCGRS